MFEQHRVVADQDSLRSFDLAVPAGDGLVLYGGTLSEGKVELPSPTPRRVVGVPGEAETRLVYVPRHRCEVFDLRLRFGKKGPPEVLVLDGAFERDIADPGYRGRTLQPDAAGEVHVQFRHLTPGLVYGARWADQP
ncbi:hypothetical protein AB0F52_01970 [Amycolatopsis sp. NPDC024027]|uniref:hypothetical protein n=1 Tax=Amycolatopsis sp. NPDC024027 TaxID=3154327 RepID=UPI0033D094CE